jgi:hypothetical protein
MRHLTVFSLLTAAVFVLSPPPVRGFAGPAIVMFYGDTLPKPVHLIVDIPRLGIVDRPTTPRDVPESELSGRTYVNFTAYWHHPTWERYFDDPALLATLRPEQGSQHGRVYPPTAGRPAILLSTTPRLSRRPLAAAIPIPRDSNEFEWRGSLSAERWAMIDPLIRPR